MSKDDLEFHRQNVKAAIATLATMARSETNQRLAENARISLSTLMRVIAAIPEATA